MNGFGNVSDVEEKHNISFMDMPHRNYLMITVMVELEE